MSHNRFPPGWNSERVSRVLDHYESQTDEESLTEDGAAYDQMTHTTVEVPIEFMPAVRELLGRRAE